MNEVTTIGAHQVWLEGDTMRVVFQGLASLPEIQAIVALLAKWHDERGVGYVLYDTSRMLPFEPDVKKWVVKEFKDFPLRGVLVVGANPTLRVMMNMAIGAMELMRPKLHRPAMFMKSTAEAQAWIEADRKKSRGGN